MALRAPSLLNSGIGPEKELLAKLMVRRVGICMRASMSIEPERSKSVRWRLEMMLLKQMTPTHLEEQGFWLGTQEERDLGLMKDCLSLRRAWFSLAENEVEGRERRVERVRRRRGRRERRRRTAAIAEPESYCGWVEMDRCSSERMRLFPE